MVRKISSFSIILFLITSCYSHKAAVEAGANYQEQISWPEEYEPAQSKFYVHNTIAIKASPQVVWTILTDALQWEDWYEGARDVSFLNASDKVLQANTVFEWQTMGLNFQTTVQAFEPNSFLAWESKRKSIQGYHVWLIIPTKEGCQVITDESQKGWLTLLEKTFQKNKLRKQHDTWLAELKNRAEQGSHN